MHLALLEAAIKTLPRPGLQNKALVTGLKLIVSVAKSAATMSPDPNLFFVLKDCVQLAGNGRLHTHKPAPTVWPHHTFRSSTYACSIPTQPYTQSCTHAHMHR